MRLTLGLCAALLAVAQDPVIRVTTRLVEVNVIVRDKDGPVAGLRQDDFKIFDNSKEQKIAIFRELKANSPGVGPSAPSPKAEAVPAGVVTNRPEAIAGSPTTVTVVLFDSLNTEWHDQSNVRKQILRFLGTLTPSDRVAIYTMHHSVRVLQDFTDDPAQLTRALARYNGEFSGDLAGSTEKPPPDLASVSPVYQMSDALTHEMFAVMNDDYKASRANQTMAALEQIANHLANVAGRKNLIWVSGGFPFSIGFDDPSAPLTSAREPQQFSEQMNRTIRAINHADLAIYPVDARGLMAMPNFDPSNPPNPLNLYSTNGAGTRKSRNTMPQPDAPPSELSPEIETMQEIAARTGGRAFVNNNDIESALRKAMEDAQITYTLGFYVPAESLDNRFHDLKVKLNRSADIRYRKGYLALQETSPTEKEWLAAMHDAASSALDARRLGLMSEIERVDQPKPGSYSVALKIDFSNLTLVKNGERWVGAADILFLPQSTDGRNLAAPASKTLNFNMTDEVYRAKLKDGLVLVETIEPQKDIDHIRVVVADHTSGAIGSLSVPTPK